MNLEKIYNFNKYFIFGGLLGSTLVFLYVGTDQSVLLAVHYLFIIQFIFIGILYLSD